MERLVKKTTDGGYISAKPIRDGTDLEKILEKLYIFEEAMEMAEKI